MGENEETEVEPTPETEEEPEENFTRSGGRRASNLGRNREVASKEIPAGNKLAESKLTETEKDVFDIIDEWHKSYPDHKMEYVEWLKINYPKEFEALKNSIKSYDNEVEESKLIEAPTEEDEEFKKLCAEIEFQADENDFTLTKEDIKGIAKKMIADKFFFNHDIFADEDDEEAWGEINDLIVSAIEAYPNKVEESKLTEDEDLSYIDSDTNNCKVYYAVNSSGYKSLGLIVNDKDKKFQVVAGQKLRTGSKTAKKSKKQIWDMAKELKDNGYEEVRGPSSVAGEVDESKEIKTEKKIVIDNMGETYTIDTDAKTYTIKTAKGEKTFTFDKMNEFVKAYRGANRIYKPMSVLAYTDYKNGSLNKWNVKKECL